jgi:hypothetical protein
VAEKPKKIRYTSRSLERHILAPRAHVWSVLLTALERGVGDGDALVETVLSFEPPWRRSSRIEGEMPLDFYERTFVLRDDGDECHLSCGVVVDPEPTEAGWEFLDLAMDVIGGFMDQVVARAQA